MNRTVLLKWASSVALAILVAAGASWISYSFGEAGGIWTDTDQGSKRLTASVMKMARVEFYPTPGGRTAISESGFIFGLGEILTESQMPGAMWRYVTDIMRTKMGINCWDLATRYSCGKFPSART